MSKSNEERRAKAAAQRQAQLAAESRERKIRWIGTAVVVVLVAGIIGVAVLGSRNENAPSNGGTFPAAVDATNATYTFNPNTSAKGTLELWEDFQCPACRDFEEVLGVAVKKLADRNIVKVVLHPAAFLDARYTGENSSRAISAFGCATDLGPATAWEMHKQLFANQAATEGDGWDDAKLISIGQLAGIKGSDLSTFKKCVTGQNYMKWAAEGTTKFYDAKIGGTPTVILNGKEVDLADQTQNLRDPAVFYAYIKANANP